jgi:hypothetical protein
MELTLSQEYLNVFGETVNQYFLILVHVQQSLKISSNDKTDLFERAKKIADDIFYHMLKYDIERTEFNRAEKKKIIKDALDKILSSINEDIDLYKGQVTIDDKNWATEKTLDYLKSGNHAYSLSKKDIENMLSFRKLYDEIPKPPSKPRRTFDEWCKDADKCIVEKWSNFKKILKHAINKQPAVAKPVNSEMQPMSQKIEILQQIEIVQPTNKDNHDKTTKNEKMHSKIFRIINYIPIIALALNEILKNYQVNTGITNEQIVMILMFTELLSILFGNKKSVNTFMILFIFTAIMLTIGKSYIPANPGLYYLFYAIFALLLNTIDFDKIAKVSFPILGILSFIYMLTKYFDIPAIITQVIEFIRTLF